MQRMMGVVLVLPLAKTSQTKFFNVIEKSHQGKLYYQNTGDRINVSLINILSQKTA